MKKSDFKKLIREIICETMSSDDYSARWQWRPEEEQPSKKNIAQGGLKTANTLAKSLARDFASKGITKAEFAKEGKGESDFIEMWVARARRDGNDNDEVNRTTAKMVWRFLP